VASLKAAVAEATKTRTKVYLCISNIAVADVSDMSNKVEKRLGKKGKAVRDCVKVIDVDPKSTTTTKDDGPETTS
jgi:flavoprotein